MNPVVKQKNLTESYTAKKCFITELSNSAGHPYCSIALARAEPGVTINWHWLHQTDEMYYIRSDKGQFKMEEEFIGTVEKGYLAFIPGNSKQRLKNLSCANLVFLCVCTHDLKFIIINLSNPVM